MSPTPARRSRCSRRWAAPCRTFAHLPLLVDAAGGGLSKRTGFAVGRRAARARHRAAARSARCSRATRHRRSGRAGDLARGAGGDGRLRARRPRRRALLGGGAGASQRAHPARPCLMRPCASALPEDLGEAFWLAVRGNLARLADADDLGRCRARADRAAASRMPEFLADAAAKRCRPSPGRCDLESWTSALSAATAARAGRCSIRSGSRSRRETGPEMARLLPLIGRDRPRRA